MHLLSIIHSESAVFFSTSLKDVDCNTFHILQKYASIHHNFSNLQSSIKWKKMKETRQINPSKWKVTKHFYTGDFLVKSGIYNYRRYCLMVSTLAELIPPVGPEIVEANYKQIHITPNSHNKHIYAITVKLTRWRQFGSTHHWKRREIAAFRISVTVI